MSVRGSLIKIKSRLVCEIYPKYCNHFDTLDKEEFNYIMNLVNEALFEIEDETRIEFIYIEAQGFLRMNRLTDKKVRITFKKDFLSVVKDMEDICEFTDYDENDFGTLY